MDRSGRSKSKKDSKGRSKSPKVPIKTYRWEDVRRARRKGGYPWTYLYKGPFNEEVDAELFTMDHYRRTKSSSPMSGVEIHEVSTIESEISHASPNLSVDISEPSESNIKKIQRDSSFIIEELPDEENQKQNSSQHPDEIQFTKETLTLSKESCIESMGSTDSISQYLDKEERVPPVNGSNSNEGTSEPEQPVNGRERAKSEEAGPRKRKMSAESSYSRISLSKLAVMKRLREAKDKIKVPKISFPTRRGTKKKPSPPKETKKDTTQSKKNVKQSTRKLTDEKPVYIHIPLKPPPGETDEFSNMENADVSNDKNEESSKVNLESTDNKERENTKKLKLDLNEAESSTDKQLKIEHKNLAKKPPIKINPAFKQFLKEVRQLKDQEGKLTEDNSKEILQIEKPKTDNEGLKKKEGQQKTDQSEQKKDTKPEVVQATLKPDLNHAGTTGSSIIMIDDIKESISKPQINDRDDDSEMELDLTEQEIDDHIEDQDFDKLFEAKKESKDIISVPSTSRSLRSKSVEPPQRKRKLSIDSSYSRKSLSKLAIMKKLNETKNKIKSTLSLSNLFRKDSKKNEQEKQKKSKSGKEEKPKKEHKPKLGEVVNLTKRDPPKDVKPVYIHIPLKPPEGQVDEFSYLEFESKKEDISNVEEHKQPDETATVVEEAISVGTPDSQSTTNDIQIIFLTPPSDDETLDEKTPDIPETPCSDDVKFFSGKIGELKMLAQHAVDEISPNSKKHTLETVSEESPSDRSSVNEETEQDNRDESIKDETKEALKENEDQIVSSSLTDKDKESNIASEQMLVDEEDGLNEPTSKRDELKSSIKSGDVTSSPVLKKKVSFKRKTKVIKDTGEYEDIQVPKTEGQDQKSTEKQADILNVDEKDQTTKAKLRETEFITQSMSVDEEKTYLDQKIMKDTSLEEDYNKWSQKDDHEYEPVNPPEEVTVLNSARAPLPTVKIIDTEIDPGPRIVLDATKVLETTPPIVEEIRKPIFHFHQSDEHLEEEKDQQKINENVPAAKESGPSKFQVAFKHKTDQLKQKTGQLKTRLQNVKKPQFHKPNIKKPDFSKISIHKPNINLPKIPDTVQITLPFGLSRHKQTKHITTTTTTVDSKESKPSLSVSSEKSSKSTWKNRQLSTESNAGDDKKPFHAQKSKTEIISQDAEKLFDFSTFPKFMRKKAKTTEEPQFATLPKQKNDAKKQRIKDDESTSIRIPLHSEDSMDSRNEGILNGNSYHENQGDSGTEMERNRYIEDAEIDEEFEKENREINKAEIRSRWQHGSFRTDGEDILRYQQEEEEEEEEDYQLEHKPLDRTTERYNERLRLEEIENENNRLRYEEYFGERNKGNHELITDLDNLDDNIEEIKSQSQGKDGYSSEGSMGLQRPGFLRKIDVDSDEFFVVHEIHEGMKTPANTLLMNEYDPVGSNRSLQEAVAKRKQPIKKPKRKKTPHVSKEQIPCDEESVDDLPGVIPSRPKRRSKKKYKNKEEEDHVIPYQETMALEEASHSNKRLDFPRESLGILGDDEADFEMYENEKMRGKDLPEIILVTDPYKQYEFDRRLEEIEAQVNRLPEAPPRRHRSLKSLTTSENESISEITKRYMDDDISLDTSNVEELIIPTTSSEQALPKRPSRRSRSHGSSVSRASLPPSSRDEESLLDTESYTLEGKVPCTEEPCTQDIRDYMGYAIVDKLKMPRDPPLPPPRCNTGSRKKRQFHPSEQKFSTVPRNQGSEVNRTPVRPLRNYSTLSQVQTSKLPIPTSNEDSLYQNQTENKENGKISGYEEIEGDSTRTLKSEPVVQKMRERPLPAPPRPPRKTKTFRTSLKDITFQENIMKDENKENRPPEEHDHQIVEETVSTQTEPLPDEFVCEEVPINETDILVEPTVEPLQPASVKVRKELITPTHYTYEETVTHGSLLVEPLDGAQILPESQLTKERRVPIIRAEDDDEPSEPPESFKTLKDPETSQKSRISEGPQEIKLVKTEKLQVGDLDVDRLRVNQLLAGKIVVSEIDSETIKVNDIQSSSGQPFSSTDITLPPEFVQEIIKELQRRAETPQTSQETKTSEEKKTPIEPQGNILDDTMPPPPYSELNSRKPLVKDELSELSTQETKLANPNPLESPVNQSPVGNSPDNQSEHSKLPAPPPRSCQQEDQSEEPPRRPPRQGRTREGSTAEESSLSRQGSRSQMLEPEIDDQPPPRPPQPHLEGYYLPSQPPASFYALRAQKLVEHLSQDIPLAPRRKRHHQRSRPLSRSKSSSEDSLSSPQAPRSQRRHSEPSIPELTGRLMVACGSHVRCSIKRLINHFNENVLHNIDGQQDMHICIIILLVLIAGLILLGQNEDRTVIHHHHWEYFNPPKDL